MNGVTGQGHNESTKCSSEGIKSWISPSCKPWCMRQHKSSNKDELANTPLIQMMGSYLCLNDLLLGRASPEIPQGPFKQRASDRCRLDFIQQVVQSFWMKWTRNYFPGLIMRSNAMWKSDTSRRETPSWFRDSNAVRGNWKISIVTEVHPSHDFPTYRVVQESPSGWNLHKIH